MVPPGLPHHGTRRDCGFLTLESARACRDVDGMLLQHGEWDDLESPLMSRCEHDVRGGPILVGPQPIACRYAPSIPGHKAEETKLRHRSAEIVTDATLVLEELGCDDRGDCVAAPILGSRPAAPVAIEAGHRVGAARLQLAA